MPDNYSAVNHPSKFLMNPAFFLAFALHHRRFLEEALLHETPADCIIDVKIVALPQPSAFPQDLPVSRKP